MLRFRYQVFSSIQTLQLWFNFPNFPRCELNCMVFHFFFFSPININFLFQIWFKNAILIIMKLECFSINENDDKGWCVQLPIWIIVIVTCTLPIVALTFCITWSLLYYFEDTTSTECKNVRIISLYIFILFIVRRVSAYAW